MAVLQSRINPGSDDFAAARANMVEKLDEARGAEEQVRSNSAAKKSRFDERGQLLPRERVARLVDRDASFLEIAPLAGLKMHDDDGGGGAVARRRPQQGQQAEQGGRGDREHLAHRELSGLALGSLKPPQA